MKRLKNWRAIFMMLEIMLFFTYIFLIFFEGPFLYIFIIVMILSLDVSIKVIRGIFWLRKRDKEMRDYEGYTNRKYQGCGVRIIVEILINTMKNCNDKFTLKEEMINQTHIKDAMELIESSEYPYIHVKPYGVFSDFDNIEGNVLETQEFIKEELSLLLEGTDFHPLIEDMGFDGFRVYIAIDIVDKDYDEGSGLYYQGTEKQK